MQVHIAIARGNERDINAVMPCAGVRDERAELGVKSETEAGIHDWLLGVVVKTNNKAIPTADDTERLACGC